MKHISNCPNCNTENPFYNLTCKECGAFLRTRYVNIDLWKTIWNLFLSPVKTFREIIFAEHKNFVIILSFIFGIKFFTDSYLLKHALTNTTITSAYLIPNIALSILYVFGSLALFSFLIKILNNLFGIKNRFKDNFSIYIFVFVPQILALIILMPVEYALFGQYWFTYNPSPFLIKSGAAYVLLILEGIMLVWSLFLSITATYAQTKNVIYSILFGIVYLVYFYSAMLYLPLFPF